MNFLCRIGLHGWCVVGWRGLVMPGQVQQCVRCGCGREVSFDCTLRYTKEQMDSMLAAAPQPRAEGMAMAELLEPGFSEAIAELDQPPMFTLRKPS